MRFLFLCLFFSISFLSSAQLLQDPQARNLISQGLKHLYQYEFRESSDDFNAIKATYPKHPVGYLLTAMQLEQQFFPLKDHPAQSKTYVAFLELAYNLAQEGYDRNKNDLESSFFCTASLGFLAAFEADNQNFIQAVSHARKAYSFMKIGLKNTERQPEFLYSTGIYQYYRVAYPDLHPIIKPLMFFFEEGNKRLGLSMLEAGTRKAIFVRNESLFYSSYIFNKYEGTPQKGLPYNTLLIQQFPKNHWYILQRAELLTLAGQYEAADPYIEQLEKISSSNYFKGAAHVLRGIREEFGNKRYAVAEALYAKALTHPWEEKLTKDLHGLALLGISRLEYRKGNKAKGLYFAKKAADFVEYKNSITEQKRLLKLG
jgi:hypothetical protein